MAVKFKSCLVCLVLVVLRLAVIAHTETSWLRSYENVTVEITQNYADSGKIMLFEAIQQVFSFEMTEQAISHYDKNLSVSVDGRDVPFSRFENDLSRSIYTGIMRSKCCKYKTVVKITKYGLDAVIKSESETFYLEPCQKYLQKSCKNETNKGATANYSTKQYNNIFYRSTDVNMQNLNGTMIDLGGKVFDGSVEQDLIDKRKKRYITTATDCTVHIVADHTFYQSTGNSDLLTTMSEMTYLVFQANLIFRGTDFDGDGAGDNIGFHISKITVFTNASYLMANAPDVDSYLDIFSQYDFSEYCIGTAFASRDFNDGIIGLAWVADSNPHGPIGGICQRRILYNGVALSLNTNLVTNVNSGEKIPMYITGLTYAHEMGHSFGSPHDNLQNSDCVPNDIYGNYLMFPYSSSGELPNNNVFSPCSVSYIYPVLRNKATCFKEAMQAVCGNGLIEDGEECDCGSSKTCSNVDKCCTPSDISTMDPDKPCTFRRSHGSQCSPRKSHCCSHECSIVAANINKVCKIGSDCKYNAVCNGASAECPDSVAVNDTTPCSKGTKSCLGGMCIGSVCATIGLNSCTCSGTYSCYVCCSNLTVCKPYLSNVLHPQPLHVGSSCQDGNGFCDGSGRCIALDHASTLDRLSHVFSSENAENFKAWLKDHWYYVVLAIVAIAFLVLVFVITCRGNKSVQTEAYMAGRYSRIQAEAEIQKHYIQQRREKIESKLKTKIQQVRSNSVPMSFPTAIARMMVFFPTTPMEVIVTTLKQSANEEAAVRLLILRKYPFRRLEKKPINQGNVNSSDEKVNHGTRVESMDNDNISTTRVKVAHNTRTESAENAINSVNVSHDARSSKASVEV